MKCPNCNIEIDKFTDICPNCKIDIFEYEKTKGRNQSNREETTLMKTAFIKTINILQLIGFVIMAIVSWNAEESLQGFIYIVIGLVVFAFIKGFSDIIDLLDSINHKLDK